MLLKLAAALPPDPVIEQAIKAAPIVSNALGYDPWGFRAEESAAYYKIAHYVYRYFRPVVHGIENLPEGRVLLVPNHSGQLPLDGIVIGVACVLEAKPPRVVRAMVERWFSRLPYVSQVFSRAGVVLGDPVNCRNLLEADNAILVFPEGARGSGKTWDHRYKLVKFGRGFMRLALQANAPIVPVAVVGAEESIVSIHDVKPLARLLHMPYFPLSPLLPVLGPLAYLPLPTRFHVYFGEPMRFTGPFDDEDEAIEAKVQVVMNRVQTMIDDGLARRKSVFG
ncbi:MAG: acyltransferase family protein [Polyangiaceae bacterium]|jgi:1-acyl-sn-glycerol-3-phosphate acyltransferase|nr:acyltransferase family protein [Polyangiaceae bacterium]